MEPIEAREDMQELVEFWFGGDLATWDRASVPDNLHELQTRWFSDRDDAFIAENFKMALFSRRLRFASLGTVLLYGQVPRHVFRGTEDEFMYLNHALRYSEEMKERVLHFRPFEAYFVVLPFMDSEELAH